MCDVYMHDLLLAYLISNLTNSKIYSKVKMLVYFTLSIKALLSDKLISFVNQFNLAGYYI